MGRQAGWREPTDTDYAQAGTSRQAATQAADSAMRETPKGGGLRGSGNQGSGYKTSETENSGQYGDALSTSKAWWGQYDFANGSSPMSDDFGLFSEMYAQDRLGQAPGSFAARQMNDTYNPYYTGAALGKGMTTVPGQLGQADWLSNMATQSGSFFMDPVQIVSGTLQQLAHAGQKFAQGQGDFSNILDSVVNPAMSPGEQLENLVGFLGEALKGSMNPTTLENYLQYVRQMGLSVLSDVVRNGAAGFGKGGGNIATALIKVLGPTGGL